MVTLTSKDFVELVKRIQGKDAIVLKASKNTIDRSGTFAVNESILEITKTVNLKKNYLKSGINYVKRPTNTDLTAVVRANVRGTLLSRYPHSVNVGTGTGRGGTGGGTVSVNKGSSNTIKGLRYVTLRGSGERVLGVNNIDAVEIFRKSLHQGKGATPNKVKKFLQIKARAKKKPYGKTPLHSSSINELFSTARHTIQPKLKIFMQDTFLENFKRLDR